MREGEGGREEGRREREREIDRVRGKEGSRRESERVVNSLKFRDDNVFLVIST